MKALTAPFEGAPGTAERSLSVAEGWGCWGAPAAPAAPATAPHPAGL